MKNYKFDKADCGCSIKYYPKSGAMIRHFCEGHGEFK